MKTATKQRARYFTDGEYFWKASGAGVQVRRADQSEWKTSCYRTGTALFNETRLTEVSPRKGEF